jgi:hypothetical protein
MVDEPEQRATLEELEIALKVAISSEKCATSGERLNALLLEVQDRIREMC